MHSYTAVFFNHIYQSLKLSDHGMTNFSSGYKPAQKFSIQKIFCCHSNKTSCNNWSAPSNQHASQRSCHQAALPAKHATIHHETCNWK